MAHVQTITKTADVGVNTLAFDPMTVTAGNTLVFMCKSEGNLPSTPTDGVGTNIFTAESPISGPGSEPEVIIAHVGNIVGGTFTFTANFPGGGGAGFIRMTMSEYNNMPANANNRDQLNSGTGTQTAGPTNPPLTADVTTTQADEVCVCIVGAYTVENFTLPKINGVAATVRATFTDTIMFDLTVSSTFTGHGQVTMDANSIWATYLATFKANTSGGTDTLNVRASDVVRPLTVTLSTQESG